MSAIGGLRCDVWLSGFGSAEPFSLFSVSITLIRECGDTVAFAVLVIALALLNCLYWAFDLRLISTPEMPACAIPWPPVTSTMHFGREFVEISLSKLTLRT
jgi:hypothetical protein